MFIRVILRPIETGSRKHTSFGIRRVFVNMTLLLQLDLSVKRCILFGVNSLLGELACVGVLIGLILLTLVLALKASGEAARLTVVPCGRSAAAV